MGFITYLAKRKLKPGVNVDDVITLDNLIVIRYEPDFKVSRRQAISLSGSDVQFTNLGIREEWRVEITGFPGTLRDDLDQFVASILPGQTFSFDPKGTAGSPIEIQQVQAFTAKHAGIRGGWRKVQMQLHVVQTL